MNWSNPEAAVIADLKRIIAAPAVDEQYDQLEGSFGGRLLNADLARELSRDYRNKYDRLAFTRCSYEPCANYILDRFYRKIETAAPPWSKAVLFLAGGAASGKTSSVGAHTIEDYDIVFDSNLAGFAKAKTMITACLNAERLVDITYIHRPYELALSSMIDRAIESGRYIPTGPPSKLAKLHLEAQRTIIRLRGEFSEEYVGIDALANFWTCQKPVIAIQIPLAELDKNGRYCYKGIEELHAIESKILIAYRENNLSEEAVFTALAEVES